MRSRKQRQESVDSSQTQSEKKKKKKKHAKFSVSRKHKATDSLCSRQTHALHGSEGKTRETTTGHRRSDFRKDLRPPVTRWNPKRKSLRSGERGGRFYRSYPVWFPEELPTTGRQMESGMESISKIWNGKLMSCSWQHYLA